MLEQCRQEPGACVTRQCDWWLIIRRNGVEFYAISCRVGVGVDAWRRSLFWRYEINSDHLVHAQIPNARIHEREHCHVPSTQVRNINSYIVNARKTACKWYMPNSANRYKYEKCGIDVLAALTLGDGLCKAVGVYPPSYCSDAQRAVRWLVWLACDRSVKWCGGFQNSVELK